MGYISNGLMLYYELNEINAGRSVIDRSGNGFHGTATNLEVISDETFGNCFNFKGNSYIDTNNAITPLGKTGFTLSGWIKTGGNSMGILTKTQKGVGNEWNLPAEKILYIYSSKELVFEGHSCKSFMSKGAVDFNSWKYFAITYGGTKGTGKIYIDGEIIEINDNYAHLDDPDGANIRIGLSSGGYINLKNFTGQMAHFRIYNRALTPAEIIQNRNADLSALAAFRLSHPLDFNLVNEEDQHVLYIDEITEGHPLTLEITNTANKTIEFIPRPGAISPTNCHVELHFKKGVLAASSLSGPTKLKLADDAAAWEMSGPEANGDYDKVWLRKKTNQNIQPNETQKITLLHARAAGAGGSRGTKVIFKYPGVRFESQTETLDGFRSQHIDIVNHRGKKNIPLHVHFTEPNTILNNGTANDLTIRITNGLQIGSQGSIPFSTNPSSPTKFIISYIAGAGDWELAKTGEGPTDIALAGWDKTHIDQSENPQWVFTNKSKAGLAPHERLEISITGFKTTADSGIANLYVHYENIPGYWDGQFVLPIEKGSLIIKKGKVGIGVEPDANYSLRVADKAVIEKSLGINTPAPDTNGLKVGGKLEVTGGPADINARVYIGVLGNWNQFVNSVDPYKLLVDGKAVIRENLGIGAEPGTNKLHVAGGDAYVEKNLKVDGHTNINEYLHVENKITGKELQINGQVKIIKGTLILDNESESGGADNGIIMGGQTPTIRFIKNKEEHKGAILAYVTQNDNWFDGSRPGDVILRADKDRSIILESGGADNSIIMGGQTPTIRFIKNKEEHKGAILAYVTQNDNWFRGSIPGDVILRADKDGNIILDSNIYVNGKIFAKNVPHSHGDSKVLSDWRLLGYFPDNKADWSTKEVTAPSDRQIKQDIHPITSALRQVAELKGVHYRWNEKGKAYFTRGLEDQITAAPNATKEDNRELWEKERTKQYEKYAGSYMGFIAQDVEKVFPEMVSENGEGLKGIDYQQMIPVVVEAIKEQQLLIEQQKIEIKNLETALSAHENRMAAMLQRLEILEKKAVDREM